ncbi:MAG: hypothetical protein GVY30_08350 [Chloroflexi bacterium]|jgi:hypothetical protein|nr:hypothetical protein [Chloroflexota bacterium]
MNTQAESKQETLLQAVLTELERVNTTLQAVAETTAIIAKSLVNGHGHGNGPNVGPNFQRALPEYPTFEWETIGAEIVKWDRHGATVVKWQGLEFFRRRHTDYDASIWFSRYTGQKDENDRKVYARLITFSDRPRIVKGLPDEVTDRLPDAPPVASPPQEQPAPDKAPTNHPKDSPEPPTETKRSAASAATNPRVAFYQLLPQLINAGKLTTEGANQLANIAKRQGYPVALQAAQELSNIAAKSKPPRRTLERSEKVPTDTKRSEASTAAHSAPTAADLLYPKNELDAFFPRE